MQMFLTSGFSHKTEKFYIIKWQARNSSRGLQKQNSTEVHLKTAMHVCVSFLLAFDSPGFLRQNKLVLSRSKNATYMKKNNTTTK